MKRWLLLVLTLSLLLSGCDSQPESLPTAVPSEPAATQVLPTEPAGCYDPGSPLEIATNGAVRAYLPDLMDPYGIVTMGEALVVFSGGEYTTLTKLTGDTLYAAAVTTLDCAIYPEDACVQASEKGLTYYDEFRQELVFLDTNLKEVSRTELPDEIVGPPALTRDRKTLYYCTADALRALDLDSGIDRLLKEMYFPSQNITRLHFSGSIIECSVSDSSGSRSVLFISTETGELLWEALDDTSLWSHGQRYFATRSDGAFYEMLTGTADSVQPSMLHSAVYDIYAQPVLDLDSVVLTASSERETRLDLYDLGTGMRSGALVLSGGDTPWNLLGDPQQGCIWFLRYDESYGRTVLFRWDPKLSPTHDDIVYIGVRRTAENPDLDGLARCEAIAEGLSEKHGVRILIWTDATATQPSDYTLVPEYQVSLLQHNLEILDQALSQFPEGFLKEAAAGTASGEIRICMVRRLLGIADSGALNSANGLQFWDGHEDAYVCVTMGADMEQALYHELFHVIESRVLSTCSAYDNWHELNPDGFDYDYDYILNLQRQDYALTEGETRAFIDLYSMSFPKEDRARIMEYAMTGGNAGCFESDRMQSKLRQLCIGVREAFGLEESEVMFRWEQYLKEPLTE